jgi:hypothetical protein
MSDKVIRTKQVKVRFTDEEHKLAVHLSPKALAIWLREMALDSTQDFVVSQKKKAIVLPKKDPALVRQLAGIGNNLNQLTVRVNAEKASIDKVLILAKLAEISDQLNKIDS